MLHAGVASCVFSARSSFHCAPLLFYIPLASLNRLFYYPLNQKMRPARYMLSFDLVSSWLSPSLTFSAPSFPSRHALIIWTLVFLSLLSVGSPPLNLLCMPLICPLFLPFSACPWSFWYRPLFFSICRWSPPLAILWCICCLSWLHIILRFGGEMKTRLKGDNMITLIMSCKGFLLGTSA